MKKTVLLLFVLVFSPVVAASAAVLEGTVQKINHAKNEIVLNTESGTERVVFSSSTKGTENLRPGDKVKVTYTKQGEKLVAESIAPNKGGLPRSPSEMPPA
jgi:hypothetical protein